MKKYLFILAGLLCFAGYNEAEAKALKLGRSIGVTTGSASTELTRSNSGSDHTSGGQKICKANCVSCTSASNCTKCKKGYYLEGGLCKSCSGISNATCDGVNINCLVGFYRSSSTSKTCVPCSDINVSNGSCTLCERVGAVCRDANCNSGYVKKMTNNVASCVAIDFSTMNCISGYRKSPASNGYCCVPTCSGVSCVSGYTATVTNDNKCCCQSNYSAIANCQSQNQSTCTKCNSGYLLKNNTCTSCPSNATCSGSASFTCNTGYKKNSAGTGCEKDLTACLDGKIYNSAIGKCVLAVCPNGCADSCVGGCHSCNSGFYLSYDNGMCPTCSSAISHCATCSSSASGVTCTTCESGYTKSGNTCVSNGSSGSNSGSGSNLVVSGKTTDPVTCVKTTVTNCGIQEQLCRPSSDYGKSCTSGSQCTSGNCATCVGYNGSTMKQGSSCR